MAEIELTTTEIKITVGKLVSLAYDKDNNLTTEIMGQRGSFRLEVDESGAATFSGNVGIVHFSGKDVLDTLGVVVGKVSVIFHRQENGRVQYNAIVSTKSITFSALGYFDPIELITSCSGLLCRAARALKGRHRAYEMELQRIMGI